MASIKLTNAHREEILQKLLEHRFGEESKKLNAEIEEIASDAYEKIFGNKMIRQMYELPEGWLPETSAIRITVNGSYKYLRFNVPNDDTQKRIPASKNGGVLYQFEKDDKITKRIEEYELKHSNYIENYREVKAQVRALLASVTTLGKLHAVWPEVQEFTKDIPGYVYALPVVQTEKLNTMLGLITLDSQNSS